MNNTSNGQFWTLRLFEVEPGQARAGLGQRLRAVRQRRLNLTLAEFGRQVAELSGRTRSFSNVTVANWESGRQEPNFATLNAIARLADLPLCYFAGVGQLDDFPRIDWFVLQEHTSDSRLRRLVTDLQELSSSQRRLAMSAIEGLLEGLHKANKRAATEATSGDGASG
jgi:transcriptional regulator with XRE-family HTH domain